MGRGTEEKGEFGPMAIRGGAIGGDYAWRVGGEERPRLQQGSRAKLSFKNKVGELNTSTMDIAVSPMGVGEDVLVLWRRDSEDMADMIHYTWRWRLSFCCRLSLQMQEMSMLVRNMLLDRIHGS